MPDRLVFSPNSTPVRWKKDAAESFRLLAERRSRLWPGRSQSPTDIERGLFRFLNDEHDLSVADDQSLTLNWSPDVPRLWKFHLQCHEYLETLSHETEGDLAYQIVTNWLADQRHHFPTSDPDAWHPFCISRRVPVWMSLAATTPPPKSIESEFWSSLSCQLQWLRKNMEWDLGGNHLLENLTTLYLAEAFLELDTTRDIRETTEQRLLSELEKQILPSGEHFERAPTYHALMVLCVLECLEAASFAKSPAVHRLARIAHGMTRFLEWIQLPNGDLPLFADSVVCETPNVNSLLTWEHSCSSILSASERECGVPSPDYWISADQHGNKIVMDAGPLACDHLPAHGHADLFQCEASIGGRAAIVDTGNYEYAASEMRQHCRGTSSHNVLQLGSENHCDIWSSFRMGDRGHPIWVTQGETSDYRWCAAAHDAYSVPACRLLIASRHHWIIVDWHSQLPKAMEATSRLHWHPDWSLTENSQPRTATAECSADRPLIRTIRCIGDKNIIRIDPSYYCPDFGVKRANQVLVNRSAKAQTNWLGHVIELRQDAPEITVSVDLAADAIEVNVDDRLSIHVRNRDGRVS